MYVSMEWLPGINFTSIADKCKRNQKAETRSLHEVKSLMPWNFNATTSLWPILGMKQYINIMIHTYVCIFATILSIEDIGLRITHSKLSSTL